MSEPQMGADVSVSINQMEGVATSKDPEFFNPVWNPPPLGVQLWVMTTGGVAVRTVWRENAGFLAWCPMPKSPPWLKDMLFQAYKSVGRAC